MGCLDNFCEPHPDTSARERERDHARERDRASARARDRDRERDRARKREDRIIRVTNDHRCSDPVLPRLGPSTPFR